MARAVLAWVLTAAFLATVPVTGAGLCPCRLAKALRSQTPPPSPTPPPATACKCCHADRTPAAPDRPSPAPDGPGDCPCKHGRTADVAPAANDRAASALTECDADAGPLAISTGADFARRARTGAFAPAPSSHSPARHIRYAHAFRC